MLVFRRDGFVQMIWTNPTGTGYQLAVSSCNVERLGEEEVEP